VTERIAASGHFELPLPAAEAVWLFTPEGERAWVPDWNPRYPAGNPSEAGGTVFATSAHGVETTWVIITVDRSKHVVAYARMTPGRHAGTVSVECADSRPGYCTVSVRYDLTALEGVDSSLLDGYRPDAFATMMEWWAATIAVYLEG
jgi:hypothetical protein